MSWACFGSSSAIRMRAVTPAIVLQNGNPRPGMCDSGEGTARFRCRSRSRRFPAVSASVLHDRLPTFPPGRERDQRLRTDLGSAAMCGLTVFLSSNPPAGRPDPGTAQAWADALETMHHRGPDDTGIEFGDGVAFG